MLSLVQVSKSYPGGAKVLDQIHLEIGRGDFLYLVGGTGTGKSSLLRLLATEEAPSSGQISLFGYDLATASSSTLRAIRQAIGYVPQDIRLIPDLTVLDNISLSLSLAGRRGMSREARARIGEILERLGLSSKREKLAATLSGGESQRVAVARALVRAPELVIADEPTGAQDRDHTWNMMDLILRANTAGATAIVATHDREIVRRARKRCATLRSGRIEMEERGALCTF